MSDQTNGAGAPSENKAALPLFFKDPQPLHREQHGGKALFRTGGFGFAQGAHALPLLMEEFVRAASSYPILFANEKEPLPLAATGIQPGKNLFVDAQNHWQGGCYVPAYVRRYPFVCGRMEGQEDLVILADMGSGMIVDQDSTEGAEALFQEGKPSELMEQIKNFCFAFEQQLATTRGFVTALREQNLLATKDITFTAPGGESHKMTGLLVVDEEKFAQVPNEVFLDWRGKGYLTAIYAHMTSLGNFEQMIRKL